MALCLPAACLPPATVCWPGVPDSLTAHMRSSLHLKTHLKVLPAFCLCSTAAAAPPAACTHASREHMLGMSRTLAIKALALAAAPAGSLPRTRDDP